MSERARRVSGDGVDLAVFERGDASAPVVVLVHGYPDDHTVWDGVAAALADRYRVVAYDVRGAGASSAPDARADYRMEHLAADLAAVVEATAGERRAHVVGHDWGSIQAWEALADERIAPRIASFTSISGPCIDHVGHWLRERVAARDVRAVARQFARSWYIGLFQVPLLPELLWKAGARTFPRALEKTEGIEDVGPVSVDTATHGIAMYRANMLQRVMAPRARPVSVPVQMIAPRADRYVAREMLECARPWVQKLTIRDVDGGHWIVRKEPAAVARWIGEFAGVNERGA